MISQEKVCVTEYVKLRSIQTILFIIGVGVVHLCGYYLMSHIMMPVWWGLETYTGPTGYVYSDVVRGWIPETSIGGIFWVGFMGDLVILVMGGFFYVVISILYKITMLISDDYNSWAKAHCSKI